MPSKPPPYTLTAADVMALRCSLTERSRVRASIAALEGVPCITYLPAEGVFCLHAYRRVQATSPDINPLAACLRQERAERGFIARVMDPANLPDEATLDPAQAAQIRRRREADLADARLRQSEARAQALHHRLTANIDVTALDLDELF